MRIKNFKLVALMLLLVFSLTVVGCGGAKEEPKKDADKPKETVVLHMGATSSPEHSYYRAMEAYMKEIEEKSGGTLKVLREFGGVHGGERQMAEAVMRGDLDMMWTSDVGQSAAFPELGFTQLPYLFKDYDDVDARYRNGWMGEEMTNKLLAKGIRVLGIGENDFRGLSNSKKSIKSAADLKGMKIRVPEIPMYMNFFKELGALPTPMAITELATALQQKTVDGQDNGAIITWAYGLSQFQKYMTKTNHIYSASHLCISEKTWAKLSPEHQKILTEASKKAVAEQVKLNREDVKIFYQKMAEAGVEVTEASDQLKADMQAAAKKVWEDPKIEQTYGKDIMDRVRAEAK